MNCTHEGRGQFEVLSPFNSKFELMGQVVGTKFWPHNGTYLKVHRAKITPLKKRAIEKMVSL